MSLEPGDQRSNSPSLRCSNGGSRPGVPTARLFFRFLLPVLLWMLLIFSASGDRMSFQHSSRIIAPFLRWLLPALSDDAVHSVVFIVRKCAHVGEYAVLAWLVWRALRALSPEPPSVWRWRPAVQTLLIVALYAASDELHQLFVASRQASIRDVLLDTSGGVLGLILVRLAGLRRRG